MIECKFYLSFPFDARFTGSCVDSGGANCNDKDDSHSKDSHMINPSERSLKRALMLGSGMRGDGCMH